ncbi:unnamed protein product [Caenorhabditis nigoni]
MENDDTAESFSTLFSEVNRSYVGTTQVTVSASVLVSTIWLTDKGFSAGSTHFFRDGGSIPDDFDTEDAPNDVETVRDPIPNESFEFNAVDYSFEEIRNNDSQDSSQDSAPALHCDTERGSATATEPESDCEQGYIPDAISFPGNDNVAITTAAIDYTDSNVDGTPAARAAAATESFGSDDEEAKDKEAEKEPLDDVDRNNDSNGSADSYTICKESQASLLVGKEGDSSPLDDSIIIVDEEAENLPPSAPTAPHLPRKVLILITTNDSKMKKSNLFHVLYQLVRIDIQTAPSDLIKPQDKPLEPINNPIRGTNGSLENNECVKLHDEPDNLTVGKEVDPHLGSGELGSENPSREQASEGSPIARSAPAEPATVTGASSADERVAEKECLEEAHATGVSVVAHSILQEENNILQESITEIIEETEPLGHVHQSSESNKSDTSADSYTTCPESQLWSIANFVFDSEEGDITPLDDSILEVDEKTDNLPPSAPTTLTTSVAPVQIPISEKPSRLESFHKVCQDLPHEHVTVPKPESDCIQGYIPAAISSPGNDNVVITTAAIDHTESNIDGTPTARAASGTASSDSDDDERAEDKEAEKDLWMTSIGTTIQTDLRIPTQPARNLRHLLLKILLPQQHQIMAASSQMIIAAKSSPLELFHKASQDLTSMDSCRVMTLLPWAIARENASPNLVRVSNKVVAVGDLHGDIYLLSEVFNTQTQPFILLGHYVDRRMYGTNILIMLLLLKYEHGVDITPLRGNHECQ